MKERSKELIRAIRFVLFSISAGVIEFASFAALNEWTHWRYWPCYLIALTLSVLWNFTLNRRFTFRSYANVPRAILLVALYYAVFTPTTTWLGDYLTETIGWNEYIVTILNMALNLVTEFLFQRYIVYRDQLDQR